MDRTMNATKKCGDFIEKLDIDQLKLFLSSTPDAFETFNVKTLMNLYRLLKKNTQHDVKCLHVSCVLSCLQHFLDSNIDPLIWEQLADKVSIICGLLFVTSATFIKDDNIIERCTNITLEIVNINQILADSMLTETMESLLKIVTSVMDSKTIQLLILSHISCLLQNSSRETRWDFLPSVAGYMTKLSNSLLLCGNYETQVSVVEVLARCWSYIKEEHPEALFTNCPSILLHFNSYKFLNFDPECRLFLNEINNSLGDTQLVYSVPCLAVLADGVTLKKPLDPLYKEFWVDFNTSTRSISFYYMPKPGENWEVMNIEMENIVCVLAMNSSGCKSKEGKIISTIKIEVTLKFDPAKPNLPQVLRLYLRKTHGLAELEKNLSSKIFRDKYKSEVTYTNLLPDGAVSSSPTPQPKFAKRKKTKTSCSKYNRLEISVSQTTSLTPTCNLGQNSVTLMETSTAAKPVAVQQFPEGFDSGQSDMVGPSLIIETKRSRKNSVAKNQTSQSNISILSQSSQCSDTFPHHFKKLNKQNQTSSVVNDSKLEVNETAKLDVGIFNNKVENLNKTENNCVVLEHTNSDGKNKKIEFHESIDPIEEKISKASLSESRNEQDGDISFNKTVSLKGQQLVSNVESSKPVSSQLNRHETYQRYVPGVQNDNCQRKHLYSVDNMNTTDFVMSSQEDFSLEVPNYKLRKPEPTVVRQRGPNKDNISFSYINFMENYKKIGSICKANVFTDLDNLNHNETCNDERMEVPENPLLKEPTPLFKHRTLYNDKKLKALNKTSENAKASGLFPTKTIYSDFSSTGKDVVGKKTYARKKPKKGMKRINIIMSSDSESDYTPPTKIPLRKEVVRGYVTRPANKKVDYVQDVVCADEMELQPMKIEEPDMVLAEIHIGEQFQDTRSTAIKKGPKKNKEIVENKKAMSQKNTYKSKKGVGEQIKKVYSQKEERFLKDNREDLITPVLDCDSYLSLNANEILGVNDIALEMFDCTASKKFVSSQCIFKMSDMIKFGKFCTLKMKNEIHKVKELLHKEWETNVAAFDFKVQNSCTALERQRQQLEIINSNFAQARVLLDSTSKLQKQITAQIKSEMAHLETTKQEVIKNMADMKKSEPSKFNSEFKKMRGFMNNLILSYIPNKSAQN